MSHEEQRQEALASVRRWLETMEGNPCLANALTLRSATEDLHRVEMDIEQENIAAALAKEMSP